jgi:hypothetical protein
MANPRRVTLMVSAVLLILAVCVAAETKGHLTVNLSRPALVSGTQIDRGDLSIAWVSNSPEASVSFSRNGKVIKETQGRFVERESKAYANMLILVEGQGGSEVLKEIRFKGKKQVLTIE